MHFNEIPTMLEMKGVLRVLRVDGGPSGGDAGAFAGTM